MSKSKLCSRLLHDLKLKSMLPDLDVALGALEDGSGAFRVYEVSRANFEASKYEPASVKSKHLWFMNTSDIERVGDLLEVLGPEDLDAVNSEPPLDGAAVGAHPKSE